MASKPLLVDSRADWRGGLNTTDSPDLLNTSEFVEATNVRLNVVRGAFAKRTGSRRLHAVAIGSGNPVRGVIQWDAPAGKEIVAICNGNFYHKTTEFGAFTEVIPASLFSLTGATHFAPFRSTSAGAALVLYMTSANGNVYSWDGTTLTKIDGVNSVPNSDLLMPYHTRVFYHDIDLKKHLFWTKVGDATDATILAASDGGAAIVDLLSGEAVVALQVIGSSLAIATEDSIVRFTGYSNLDIKIEQDTEGITNEIGAVGSKAFGIFEGFGVVVSDRGVYQVTESDAIPIGSKVELDLDNSDRTKIANAIARYNRGRKEILIPFTDSGDAGINKSVLAYNTRLQAWTKFTYTFGINDLARYEDTVGGEFIIAGCGDGFVRHMDTGVKDDVLSDGTGGSNYTMTAELAPTFFETGPGMLKSLDKILLQADLPTNSLLVIKHAFDSAALTSETAITPLAGNRAEAYRVDLTNNQGNRLRLQFTDASDDIPIIHGYQLLAHNMQRLEA